VTLSSGQSFSASEWDIISAKILDQRSENIMLRANAGADSTTIANLYLTTSSLQKALEESDKSYQALMRVVGDDKALIKIYEDEIKRLKKEIRKQKALKVLGFSLAIVATFFAVN
jgi:hypothetical protein